MTSASQHTLRVARPRLDAGPDVVKVERREPFIPVFVRHGMAHPHVVRAKRVIGTAPWFKRLQS